LDRRNDGWGYYFRNEEYPKFLVMEDTVNGL